jgi:hypothetical protein
MERVADGALGRMALRAVRRHCEALAAYGRSGEGRGFGIVCKVRRRPMRVDVLGLFRAYFLCPQPDQVRITAPALRAETGGEAQRSRTV